MRNKQRLLDITRAVALSAHGVGGRKGDNFRLGCILFDKRGKVVKARTNSMKTHPKLTSLTEFPFLHAEQACILSQGIDNCDGLSLMVVRVRKDSSLANAKPCSTCEKVIKLTGIKKVFYTNDLGEITHKE